MYMIIYDDGCGLCMPMTEDPDCKGGVYTAAGKTVIFTTKGAACKALKISKMNAELCKLQDKSYNSDFVEYLKNVKIVPVKVLGEDNDETGITAKN